MPIRKRSGGLDLREGRRERTERWGKGEPGTGEDGGNEADGCRNRTRANRTTSTAGNHG